MLVTRHAASLLRKSRSWPALNPWLTMMSSPVGRIRIADSIHVMATSVSASSRQSTQPWAIQMGRRETLCSVAQPMNCWQPRAIMKDLSLMFQGNSLKRLLQKARQLGMAGSGEMLVWWPTRKSWKMYSRVSMLHGRPLRRPCTKSGLTS